jgi:hypothetical protein
MPEPDLNKMNTTAPSVTPGSGYDDPSGAWPRKEYFNSSNVNKAAAGGKRNDLTLFAVSPSVDFNLNEPVESEYPLNQVSETVSGHVIEIDDTPGNERVLIKHNTGGGIELRNDGSVIITSKLHRIESVGGDNKVVIQGEADLVYKGNLNLTVTGDYNVDVKGDYNVKVGGNRTSNVAGSDRRTINGSVGDIVTGGYSQTVNGQVTNTLLGGMSNNVKGTYSNNVDGAANYVSSGKGVYTSETQLYMSSADMNIAANSLSVFGDTGTIGGENIIMYNYNMWTGHSVWAGDTVETQTVRATKTVDTTKASAVLFVGDLEGTADQSKSTSSQNYGEAATSGSSYTRATSSVEAKAYDATVTAKPTASLLTEYLTKAAGGIRKVKIDVGDFIKNFINKSVSTGGVSATVVDTPKARSRMRDPANRANEAFVGNMIANQTICSEYSMPTPKGIGRIIKGGNSPEQGASPIGPGMKPSNIYIPSPGPVTIIPDINYNPYFAGEITSKTKLAPGITFAKFLGTEDPTNLNFIKDNLQKIQIAKYYYLHAQIIKAMQDDDNKFKNFNLVVTEGLYRPGPDETITPGSINDLKLKGKAVVYNLISQAGVSSPTALFDLAVYWKTKINYDKMILSYDTIDCKLNSRLIIVLPEIDDEWEGVYSRTVETEFNNNKLTQGDLIEVLAMPSTAADSVSFTGTEDTKWYKFKEGIDRRVDPELLLKVAAVAEEFGTPFTITDGYREPGTSATSRGVGKTSQHALGNAVDIRVTGMSKADVLRIAKIASSKGIGGIGIYTDSSTRSVPASMHFDGRASRVAWGHDFHYQTLPSWSIDVANQHIAGKFVGKTIA